MAMFNQELPSEIEPPRLQMYMSKYSEIDDVDLGKQSPPQILKLRKLNSVIEGGEQLEQILNRQIDTDYNKEETPQTADQKWLPCSCTKTRCLKMYCSCFHNGHKCGGQCKCEDCNNTEEHEGQRHKAVEHIKKKAHRNKKVPQEKIFETKDVWGCNCRKTRCLKRYCECYIRGKTCTVDCNCNHCENGKDEDLYNEIRRQNEKPTSQRRQRLERKAE